VPGGVGPGAKGKGVTALRRRLEAEGDLASGGGDAWGPDVVEAIKKFQDRMGLRASGQLTPATLKAMNIPAAVRFRQLASSAQRVAGINFNVEGRYVVVNIPSATVEAIDHNRVVHRYIAVVGDPEHRSPEENVKIQSVNLNPYWTLPSSIIKNEIIPKMRKDPGYLSRAHIRILDGHGTEINPRTIDWSTERAANYILRQDSGDNNALGNIRINMPNKDAVYLHDTPSKRFFGGDYRFLSHGCVRVEGVYDLASWLLDGASGAPGGRWDRAALLSRVATGEHIEIKLAQPVPVIWVYMTGWANGDGVVHFRDDIYDYDRVGGRAKSAAL
jgi:murein L,D-transpeptidase YcbB/YkuD